LNIVIDRIAFSFNEFKNKKSGGISYENF
jgi:hypothetical protein